MPPSGYGGLTVPEHHCVSPVLCAKAVVSNAARRGVTLATELRKEVTDITGELEKSNLGDAARGQMLIQRSQYRQALQNLEDGMSPDDAMTTAIDYIEREILAIDIKH